MIKCCLPHLACQPQQTTAPLCPSAINKPRPPAADRKVISLGGLDPREVIDALVPATHDVPTP
eukprot:6755312-Karenia_brevis.AAC.1